MPPTPIRRDREASRASAASRVALALAAALVAGAIGLGAGVATAQAPGLERFARQPETPIELWDAISYLVRVGRADQAKPLLDRFLELEPSDETLIEIRDRFGLGSFLRLEDDPRTAGRTAELLNRLSAATRRIAQRGDQIRQQIGLLTGSPLQQSEALLRLRESGPHAVPYLIEALRERAPGSPERALLVGNMGRLDSRAVPALVAAIDAPEPELAADMASVLGRIGDRRALPFLIAAATGNDDPDPRAPVRQEAAEAIRRLTGSPLDALTMSPSQFLLEEAKRYLNGSYHYPSNRVELWTWQEAEGNVSPRVVRPEEASAILGLRFARKVLELEPDNPQAEALETVLQVRELAQQAGAGALEESGTLPEHLLGELVGRGPDRLSEALGLALDARFTDAAPVLATALGMTRAPDQLLVAGSSPLLLALSAPDRRTQLEAARAIVELEPASGFPGASRVVPVLARSLELGEAPQIVVVSGNVSMHTTIATSLRDRGFEPITASTADEGFRRASESAGVEAMIIDPNLLRGARDARDLLIDLRADSRTAGLPVLLTLPIDPARALARSEEIAHRQAEREPNDIAARASPVAFIGRPRRARIEGRLSMDDRPSFGQPVRQLPSEETEEGGAVDEDDVEGAFETSSEAGDEDEDSPPPDISGDLYALGPLRAGDTVSVIVEPSPGSTLKPIDVILWLERREGPNSVPVTGASGALVATIEVPGRYDLRVQASERHLYSNRALYTIDVTLYDFDVTVSHTIGSVRLKVEELARQFDRVGLLAAPGDPLAVEKALYREWNRVGLRPLSTEERESLATKAASTLARIARQPASPFMSDLIGAFPQLHRALYRSVLAPLVAPALAALPTAEAQRALADLVLDGSRSMASRIASAEALSSSIRQFGSLLATDQSPRLLRAFDRVQDDELREALGHVLEVLRPTTPRAAAVTSGSEGNGASLGH